MIFFTEPYVVSGTLGEQAVYPGRWSDRRADEVRALLTAVGLHYLLVRYPLSEMHDW